MSTITRERAELKSFITGFLSDRMHDDQSAKSMTAEVFRIALASLEAEPVAWRYRHHNGLAPSNWKVVDSEDECNMAPNYQRQALYTAPPEPVSVPDEMDLLTCHLDGVTETYAEGWNACRAAMLQELQKSAGVSNNCRSNENVQGMQAGNSPGIPDGWKLVPVEPTANQWAAGMQAFDSGVDKVTRVYKAMLAAAPQQEVK